MDSIIGFIAEDCIDEALKILERMRKKAAGLNALPERGRVVPELKEQGIILYRHLQTVFRYFILFSWTFVTREGWQASHWSKMGDPPLVFCRRS